MAISTFTFGYFWLKRATASVTDLSSAALPKAINRKLAETSDPAAKPLLEASTRPAANRKNVNFDFTGVPPYGGLKAFHLTAVFEERGENQFRRSLKTPPCYRKHGTASNAMSCIVSRIFASEAPRSESYGSSESGSRRTEKQPTGRGPEGCVQNGPVPVAEIPESKL